MPAGRLIEADGSACSPERLMRLVREGRADALDQITRCYSQRLWRLGASTAGEQLSALGDELKLERWLVKVVALARRRSASARKRGLEAFALGLLAR